MMSAQEEEMLLCLYQRRQTGTARAAHLPGQLEVMVHLTPHGDSTLEKNPSDWCQVNQGCLPHESNGLGFLKALLHGKGNGDPLPKAVPRKGPFRGAVSPGR